MVNRNPLAWHAEALEEVATSITEEAWLNNEYAIYIGFDYIHCFNLCSLKKEFLKSSLNGLYTPFGSPSSGGQKPSLPLKKEFFYLSVSPARRAPPFSPSLSFLRNERM